MGMGHMFLGGEMNEQTEAWWSMGQAEPKLAVWLGG